MLGGLQPYPAYKDSGVPWLGKVPEHWDLQPNRTLMRRRKVLIGNRHAESRLLSLTKEGVIVRDVESGKGKWSADMGTCQEVHTGDLVFCLFDVPETPRTVGLSRHDGMITGAYTIFQCPDPLLTAFLDLFYRAMDDRKLLSPLYSGLRNTIPPTRFLGTKTPVPPTDEQAAIVRFLDHADRKIRRYIRAKQKLIKLLEEQKQAIIHRAVTCGLDPNVRLKPSGVEWLGDVPEHWGVVPTRYLFRAVTRKEIRGDELKLSVTQRRGLIPTDEMQENSTQAASFERFQVCEPGDLVLNKYKAHLGVFWAASCRGLITPNYTVFRPMRSLITTFFELLFHTRTYRDAFTMTVYGVTEGMSPLYTQDFYAIPALVPPTLEQERIVAEVADRTTVENNTLARVDREISLLREYRTRLIADVVTGKLDVREAAAGLPDETEEPEPIDETEALSEADAEGTGDLDTVAEEAEA